LKPQSLTSSFVLIALFLGFGISRSYCQKKKQEAHTIEATVLDKDTKEALPFTNVLIAGTSIGTITNEEGKFELTFSKNFSKIRIHSSGRNCSKGKK